MKAKKPSETSAFTMKLLASNHPTTKYYALHYLYTYIYSLHMSHGDLPLLLFASFHFSNRFHSFLCVILCVCYPLNNMLYYNNIMPCNEEILLIVVCFTIACFSAYSYSFYCYYLLLGFSTVAIAMNIVLILFFLLIVVFCKLRIISALIIALITLLC